MTATAPRYPEGPDVAPPPLVQRALSDAALDGDSAYSGVGDEDAGPEGGAGLGTTGMDGQEFQDGDICGDWRIERFVAAGGMGEVYRACGTLGGKIAALKCMRSQLTARADLEERFETEVGILATLDCPYIVQLHHAGRHNGRPYLVMEWLDGLTLRDFMNQRREPLALADALHYASCIATALCAAHASGILHRDLKPENVFLVDNRTLKVLDFGLGKWAGRGRVSTSEQAGGPLCTVHYAAPEQLERTGVDDRTDVRALALIFFEMVTLTYAFADRPGVLPAREIARANQLFAEPNSLRDFLPGCPPSLVVLIDRAMRRDKTQRPHSTEFLVALRAERKALLAGAHKAPVAEDDGQVENEGGEDKGDEREEEAPPRLREAEISAVRVLPQLRTLTLPEKTPPADPTAAGNPLPPRFRTVRMFPRPSDESLEAARRAHAGARDPAADSTGGGRSATLPPMPGPVTKQAPAAAAVQQVPVPHAQAPMPAGPDDSAAARASLEVANRPTLPWQRSAPPLPREGTSSLSPTHRAPVGLDASARLAGIPFWAAPLLGAALALGTFGVMRVGRTHATGVQSVAVPVIAPSASPAPEVRAAPAVITVPDVTAEPTASAAPTASPEPAAPVATASVAPAPTPATTVAPLASASAVAVRVVPPASSGRTGRSGAGTRTSSAPPTATPLWTPSPPAVPPSPNHRVFGSVD